MHPKEENIQSRDFQIYTTHSGIYLLSSSAEFLEQKAKNILQYSQKAYPGMSFQQEYTIKSIAPTSKMPFAYRLKIDDLLPPIVSIAVKFTESTGMGTGHQGYSPSSVLRLATGVNLYPTWKNNTDIGYVKASAKELSIGDYIEITSEQDSQQGLVYIDEDICFSMYWEAKVGAKKYHLEYGYGTLKLCKTDEVLKAHDLSLSTLQSHDNKNITFYKRDSDIVFPKLFVDNMTEFFELASRGIYGPYTKTCPYYQLLEAVKQSKYDPSLNPKVIEIIETNYALARSRVPSLDDFITQCETEYYTILDLTHNASAEQIRKSFRTLSAIYHPDKSSDIYSAEKYRLISKAYEVLSDDEQRLAYDISKGYKQPEPKLMQPDALTLESSAKESTLSYRFSNFFNKLFSSSKPTPEDEDNKSKEVLRITYPSKK